MPITHAKVSAKSDGADTSLIRPSDWNAEHVGGDTRITVDISAAQIRGLFTTPVEMIPAPGPGKFIWPKRYIVIYTFNTTPYDAGDPFLAIDGVIEGKLIDLSGVVGLDRPDDAIRATSVALQDLGDIPYPVNKPISLISNGFDPGNSGDGTLRFIIDYEIVTL